MTEPEAIPSRQVHETERADGASGDAPDVDIRGDGSEVDVATTSAPDGAG